MNIRKVTPVDLAELVVLCAEHAAYERSHFEPQGKEEALRIMLFAPEARLQCLVAEADGKLIGYATFAVECSTWDAAYYMHMDCLFLRPEARNKGLGKQLMKAIAQQALDMGVARMQWQTPSFNVDAVRFYDRLGPVKKEKYRLFLDVEETRTLADF
ncbi:MAG TPA: GNAT family N-acetyltransferase [Flavobacteriales bacterium]|nr:GNAT family N-acetyltransferase [Flavobacteriales bacterium]